MPRPFTDIQAAISGNAVKNGSIVLSTTVAGQYSSNNLYTKNSPSINTISTKYGNKFYNGIFVELTSSSGIIGV